MQTAENTQSQMEEYDVYVEQEGGEERITFIRKSSRSDQEEQQIQPKQPQGASYYFSLVLSLFLLFSSLFIPSSATTGAVPIVTITISPKMVKVTTTQVVQLPARLLAPLTLIQSQNTLATGKGHQNTTQAKGYITFYNGLFQSQTIAAGTILRGSNGEQIIIEHIAVIPAANPPGLGHTTVSAHAIVAGAQGNIPSLTINQLCCSTAVKAVNTTAFHGGQNERYFRMVSQSDIASVSAQLTKTIQQSIQAALTTQLTTREALTLPLCSQKIMPDHKAEDEATQVTVAVSETCSAVAYDRDAFQQQALQVVSKEALKTLGAGYSLTGDMQYQLVHATFQKGQAILEITCSGIWVYRIGQPQQNIILNLIAGKPKQEAAHLLATLPGIERAIITGVDNMTELPNDTQHMHFIVIYQNM